MAGPCPSGHHLDPCPYGQAECQEGDGGHQLMRPMSRRWTSPPGILRHKHVRLENIALVPASELSSLAKWQERARSHAAGGRSPRGPEDRAAPTAGPTDSC